MKKTALAVLLSMSLALLFLPVQAAAVGTQPAPLETYSGPAPQARASWATYPVTGGNLYFDPLSIIGEDAFGVCKSLSEVYISDRVSIIGEGAFHECTSLDSVFYSGTEAQ